jgi:hypothetical protein
MTHKEVHSQCFAIIPLVERSAVLSHILEKKTSNTGLGNGSPEDGDGTFHNMLVFTYESIKHHNPEARHHLHCC